MGLTARVAGRTAWRRAADDPDHPRAWIAHALRELRSLLLLFCLVLAGLAWGTGLLVLIGGVATTLLLSPLLPYRSPRRSDDLPTLPLPEDSFPVAVTVHQEGLVTGADDAVATFVDGWLHVEGRRASFSLRATDGRGRLNALTPALAFDLGDRTIVRLDPVFMASRRASDAPTGFARTAQAWLAAHAAPPGEPRLPPLTVQPEVYARFAVQIVLRVAVGAACVLALGLSPRLGNVPLGLGTFLAIATVFAPLHAALQLDRLRRIDARELPQSLG